MKFVGFRYSTATRIVKGLSRVFPLEGNTRFLIRVEIFPEFPSLISLESDRSDQILIISWKSFSEDNIRKHV